MILVGFFILFLLVAYLKMVLIFLEYTDCRQVKQWRVFRPYY